MFRIEELNNPKRVFGLDVFRAIAILIVIFGHANYFFIPYFSHPIGNSTLGNILGIIFTGFDGVDLFFVLSGFLIGGIIIKKFLSDKELKFVDLKRFWFRRWLRTLPAYYIILVVNIILLFTVKPLPEFHSTILTKYFFFIQNLFHGGLVFFAESWSLSVEEMFYLSFPLVLILAILVFPASMQRKRVFLFTCLSYIFLILIFRVYRSMGYHSNMTYWNDELRTVAVARLDSILIGVFFAFIKYINPVFFDSKKYFFVIAGMIVLGVNFYAGYILEWGHKTKYMYTIYYSILSFGMACFLPYADSVKVTKRKPLMFFTFISIVSYSLYLVNYSVVLELMLKYIDPKGLMLTVICYFTFLIISIVLATGLYKLVEKPVLDYRDKTVTE